MSFGGSLSAVSCDGAAKSVTTNYTNRSARPATYHFFVEGHVPPLHYCPSKPSRPTNDHCITTIHKLLRTKLRSRLFTYHWISSLNWSPGESIQRTQKVRLYYQPWPVTTQPTVASKRMQTHIMLGCSLQSTSNAFRMILQLSHGSFPCGVTAG